MVTSGSCASITINTGASLTVNASYTLNIYGDFTNNGTYTANASGITAFKNTDIQTITGNTTFADMVIDNHLIVASGTEMTVDAGSTVSFKTGTDFDISGGIDGGFLEIQGKLIADGTSGNEIIFTRNGSTGDAGNLHIETKTYEARGVKRAFLLVPLGKARGAIFM